MRLFIGIELPSTVIETLSKIVQPVQSCNGSLRWTSSDSWHITLQFLGETQIEKYNCTVSRLALIRSPTVPVSLEGTGCFDRAGIFFARVNLSPELLQLHRQVLTATAECGIALEQREFHPHVTLARTRGKHVRAPVKQLTDKVDSMARLLSFTATEFLLYEVAPGAAGSRYKVRAHFPIAC